MARPGPMSKCPFFHHLESDKNTPPGKMDLRMLNQVKHFQHFSYADAFNSLDLKTLKSELATLMTTSQDWWPADYGNYGPFMVRLAWHAAGTYRVGDGRGGANGGPMRFYPLSTWPDNGNLDKARRLLYPLKQKYGKKISWGDLMILAGNVAMENMGFETFGFAGGREDIWETESDVYWGPETEMLVNERYENKAQRESLQHPLGAVQMGLIYVNPEGPDGNPDPMLSAQDIRINFGRMAMNDEETVALIAGGHTFGKAHGAAPPGDNVAEDPINAPIEFQGLGYTNNYQTGKGKDTITSGLEGAWTSKPTQWDNGYFENLFKYEWELVKGPGGAQQWSPKNYGDADVPDAHVKGVFHKPIMFTTDLALRFDPAYEKISRRFLENPEEFRLAFAKAWYKLTHRDMGPVTRCLGPEVAKEQLWQDPTPAPSKAPLINDAEIAELKKALLDSLTITELVELAWCSAGTFRKTDFRGGANGARIFLEPQISWESNDKLNLLTSKKIFTTIQEKFNSSHESNVSLADLIVLGGMAAVEKAANEAFISISIDFTPGRTDATQENTDVVSFNYLERQQDGFRNYGLPSKHALLDKAHQLSLSAPEMAVLVAGLRSLGVGQNGILTKRPGVLSNDFFVNLVDMATEWVKTDKPGIYEGKSRADGSTMWTATENDLIFGSHPELRAIAEYYAQADSAVDFQNDFAKTFCKVMNLDRDLCNYMKKYTFGSVKSKANVGCC